MIHLRPWTGEGNAPCCIWRRRAWSVLCIRRKPARQLPPPLVASVKHVSVAAVHTGAPTGQTPDRPPQLDLRLPEVASNDRLAEKLADRFSERLADRLADRPASFTSFSRHDLNSMREERETQEPPATAPANNAHALSRTEVLANHFRRQGLPVARLWENNSTLVHLGLNQKGKPGLWIVQKIQ